MHQLPSRIAAVMAGSILVFVLTIGVSILWMTRALDDQARDHSLHQIRSARANLLSQTRLITLDYAKWEAALPYVQAADLDWIFENIGSSATTGEAIQLAVVWGGPFPGDIGWADDGLVEPRSGLVDQATLDLAERRIAEIAIDSYDGVEFFGWQDGALFVLAVARVEEGTGEGGSAPALDEAARLLLGTRLTDDSLSRLGQDYLLSGLRVLHEMPATQSSLPLLGADGTPVAYLAWDMPRPGTAMLQRMLPPLLFIVLLTSGLTALGMTLVRRNAQHLVVAEYHASVAARTDAMTGLPNRAAFNEALAQPARAGERAVLFLDVNGFKRINDSIGHAAGDQVITDVARRLERLAGPGCILARIAGDEFVFVVTGPAAQPRTERLAQAVDVELGPPFSVLGHQMRLSMAMGYAVQDADGMTGDALVRQADLAMYEAKRHKGRGLVAFSTVIEQASRDASLIEQGLRRALERPGELSLAYQPIVGRDGRLVRAEALARWTSAELGPVPAPRFIAVAEQAGLIVELGRRLFQLVCDDLAAHPGLQVSINISPLQLMAPDFIPSVVGSLQRRGIDPGRIEVELTEAVLVDDPRLAAERLEELHAAGFSTALDDFGTGYSSIGYLKQMGFGSLKIDRSFVAEVERSASAVSVVNGMIMMAHGLGLCVVCEGIENQEELDLLRRLGCDLAQGYHLGRPMHLPRLIEHWLPDGIHEAAVEVAVA
ncbi:bifunctional diguanylate cyclase/phosphodiesterase [Rubellimicrobium rubrum]|uniref:Bifunctional diguanylate cyclase/phosphodiesterase n=1 Tax=Rubellimicrobium rubrum TaxID=2585369 RepID=A0A5C4N4B9_9RHOB|nr:bifunctional diguanylate cyclase/phosphodiesterase [Rubellimicrobium rubrum]TNC52446.1 bifunctional diguanylate cyclase/phosphodiesterase [Rubellimicrobium rubrum]